MKKGLKIVRLLPVLLCLLLLGADYAPRRCYIKGRLYRNCSDAARFYRMKLTTSGKLMNYSGSGKKLEMEQATRRIYWNKMCIMLGYPVQLSGWTPCVSDSDWRSTLRVLFYPSAVPRHRLKTITLDAGHGGSDKGASGRISHEKNITLKLTRRVAAILRSCGYQVHLTRNSDVAVPLKQRAEKQRAAKTDLFVSIHVNATSKKNVSGIETYALTPADAPSTNGKAETIRHPSNRFDLNNFFLACHLQGAMISRTKAFDRGVKRARFAVLREIDAPGALVEIGFISNPAEERNLNTPAYLEKVARGIAEGIISYHRDIYRNRK